MQDSFEITYERRKERRALKEQMARHKLQQRRVFLYENIVLFCKKKEEEKLNAKRSAYIFKSALEVNVSPLLNDVLMTPRLLHEFLNESIHVVSTLHSV